jgi:hypothetical protein
MEISQNRFSKFDTPENLAAREKAIAIWNSAPAEEIPFNKVIEMIYFAQESAKGSKAEAQLKAERRILEEVKQSHDPASLRVVRALFASRTFPLSDIQRWLQSEADLLEMTANSLVEGYSEYLVGAVPSSFRSPASLIETMRRRDIDHNQDFGDFASFYSDAGKE